MQKSAKNFQRDFASNEKIDSLIPSLKLKSLDEVRVL